jgi:hypothetical protein
VRSLRAPHGSVTANVTFPSSPLTPPLTVRGNADKDGRVKLLVPNLPKGKARIEVLIDDQGTVGCTLDVDVVADATLTCLPR